MKVLETQIEIAAPAARMWEILADFATYPEWNPFIKRAAGELRQSMALTFRPAASASPRMPGPEPEIPKKERNPGWFQWVTLGSISRS